MGLLGLFQKKHSEALLGVDIGASGIKLVELGMEGGRAKLLTYGYSEGVPDLIGGALYQDPKRAAQVLSELLKASGATSRHAVASLPGSSVYASVIAIPEPDTQESAEPLIREQARKLIPLPLEEMVLSTTFIDPVKKKSALKKEVGKGKSKMENVPLLDGIPPKQSDGGRKEEAMDGGRKKQKNVRVLISAAPKSLVQNYVEIFKGAGVTLDALDTESFGLLRALVGKDRSSILLIDMGATRTNLTIIEKGVPFVTQSVQVGGLHFTQQLAKVLGVTIEEAEQMKFDLAMSEFASTVPTMLDQVFGQLLNEVRYVFGQYKRQEWSDGKQVEKVVLTGGSSHLPGLVEFFVSSLNLNTYLGDPWARVLVPEDLRLLLDEKGPSLSIAVGLAMRNHS